MPRRRSVPLSLANARVLHRSFLIRRLFLFCAAAIVFASSLMLTGVVDSAQQRTTKVPTAARQPQKTPKRQKTTAPERDEGISTRGIELAEVPDFKAEAPAHALIIGISSYPHLQPRDQLKFADADAQALRDFLVSDKEGFKDENVTLLLNEQATRDQILRELGRLQNNSGPSSLVLVFFAGHGVVNKAGQAFLVASNTKADDLHASGLDMTTVNNTIQSMRARSVVIMTDACHAGAIANTLNLGPVTNLTTKDFAVGFQREDQSSFIFSAASPNQASNEDASLRHGLFTYFVLQGLGGEADGDGDGVVTSQELYRHVDKALAVENQKRNLAQVPEFNPRYDRSIPLAIINEAGRAKYQQWFRDDSLVARLVALFDEALKENRLTKPADQSAWDYFARLKNYAGTPPSVAAEKKTELLRKIESVADTLIEQLPTDPGKWNEASSNLEKAYELTGDNNLQAKQLFCSVMFYHQTGETDRAESKCDSTLDVIEKGGATDALISVRIGQFYKSLKKWEKARRAYRLGVGEKANESWLTEYAEVLIQLSTYDEAEAQLRQALRTNPQHQPALVKLSAILLREPKKDRLEESLNHITRARALKPDDLEAEEVFGRVKLEMGETQQAIDSLLKVASVRPPGERRDQALLYLSQSYHRAGDLDRAVSALREAETTGSQNAAIFEKLAELLDERGDVKNSIGAAQRAVALTPDKSDRARRLQLVAEYVERSGQLVEAAYQYRNAEAEAPDAKLRSLWGNRAAVLFLRNGQYQHAGVSRTPSLQQRATPRESSPVIVPGGREALSRLTGVPTIQADPNVLARVFDACLRDPELGARLVRFYEDYPEFSRKTVMRGGSLSGILALPPPSQTPPAESREALKFFGINDKKGIRQVKLKEFESRRYILEALGGDPEKLKLGELVNISFRDEELPVVNGMASWLSIIKDGPKAPPDEQLLAFLKDKGAMKLYVAFSQMPEEAAARFGGKVMTKENRSELPDTLYFAAPYLRFDSYGDLEVPGQRQGERNWDEALKSNSKFQLLHSLFQKGNGGALYLFCALSSAGEVGDFIARSNSFEQLFRMFNQSAIPREREPFDFIDLLRQMKVENDQLRLPQVVEVWRRSSGDSGDPVLKVLFQIGKISAGQQIPLVKQIAVLNLIERERPDWAADRDVIELIADQVARNRESQLEVALDLEMSKKQLSDYFALIKQIDDLPPSTARTESVRLFQSVFELLRYVAKNSSLPRNRITDLTDQLLRLDPSRSEYGLQSASFVKSDLLDAGAGATGAEVEAKLIELLADEPLVEMPLTKKSEATGTAGDSVAAGFMLYGSKVAPGQIKKFLEAQKHTRLSSVFDALNALDELDKDPSSVDALGKLKANIAAFVEPEREPESKKKKSKKPVTIEPTLKETIASQSLPVGRPTVAAIRSRIAPFIGEALLAEVYAISAGSSQDLVPFKSDLVLKHDFGASPWSATRLEEGSRITGNLVALSQALNRLSAASPAFGARRSAFVEATLNSFQLVRRRSVTRDGEEFVARMIDLGEDVLALYVRGDQSPAAAFKQLDRIMSQRRAQMIKTLADQREIERALSEITLSELYSLGRVYFDQRLATTPLEQLGAEPGALGALARVVSRTRAKEERGISIRLRREIDQFGMSTASRNGLSRLELIEPEPYEQAAGFRDAQRLAERAQDLKLALARRAHRLGGGAVFPLSPVLAQRILSNILAQTRKAASGTPTPERDWLSLIRAIQTLGEGDFVLVVDQIANSGDVRPVVRTKWNDPRSNQKLGFKPEQ